MRPVSSTERAKTYDTTRRRSSFTPHDDATPPLAGALVDLKSDLEDFEARFYEPRVGTFMDTTLATQGHLYDVRDELRRETTYATICPCSSSV